MDTFTASNGITVYVHDGGTVQFQHGTRDESCGNLNIFPGSEWWETLREFFRAEEDERLGRWRWSENPDYVVYVADDAVLVRDESQPAKRGDRITRDYCEDPVGTLGWGEFAARAYFNAHPEPKPWHGAKLGEVWEITFSPAGGGTTSAWMVGADMRFRHPLSNTVARDDYTIVAGRRIYPEAADA